MLTSSQSSSELSAKFDRANYSTRDRIGCGLTCSTCSHCIYSADAHLADYPDRECYCTLSRN